MWTSQLTCIAFLALLTVITSKYPWSLSCCPSVHSTSHRPKPRVAFFAPRPLHSISMSTMTRIEVRPRDRRWRGCSRSRWVPSGRFRVLSRLCSQYPCLGWRIFRPSFAHFFAFFVFSLSLSACVCVCATELVLGRVNDSSESDSSLFAFFAGEREDSSKMSRTQVRVFTRVI
jgi:hypothetical protein